MDAQYIYKLENGLNLSCCKIRQFGYADKEFSSEKC